ncbi:hypothetical protein Ndes2526B_g00034 [Nannochloris sp. 'desiccata']
MDGAATNIKDFAKNSFRLLKRCEKPDRKEFWKVARLTSVGFLAVGFLGFFVKLVFIPINQIIVSSSTN